MVWGSALHFNLRVRLPGGSAAQMANVDLRERSGRQINLGNTNASGDLTIVGAHTGDQLIIFDQTRTTYAVETVTASGTITSTLISLIPEEEFFAQVRGGSGGQVNTPLSKGAAKPLDVKVTLGSNIQFNVSTPGGERIQWATFTPSGGQMTSMNGTGGAAGTTYNLSLGKWDDGVVSIFANVPTGQALASMRVSVAKIGGASDQEVFGPGGQVALHGFGRTAKGTVLMNDVQKANPAPRGRRFVNAPVQIQASSVSVLNGAHIEMRIPMTRKGPMISSIRPTGLLIHKWDEAKKDWLPLNGASTNAGWGMVSAPITGPGMYAVTTSGSGNEFLELLAANIF
ncbi:MAG: hypothetical protein R2688_07710 [Fimbriimonadaceae bacterium]